MDAQGTKNRSIERFRGMTNLLFRLSCLFSVGALVLWLPVPWWGENLYLHATASEPSSATIEGLSSVFRITQVEVSVEAQTLAAQVVAYADIVITCAVWTFTLYFLRKFAFQLSEGGAEAFWRVGHLINAVKVFVACYLLSLVQKAFEAVAVSRIEGRNQADSILAIRLLDIQLLPLVAIVAVLAFAAVMKQGALLQEDVERTV